ncbi:MAG TPA: hypothetical protein VFY41_09415 [Nitrososphaeraceae archaeon]|nr:hypothetical protein [Nitrososphaeraceae archaeon]
MLCIKTPLKTERSIIIPICCVNTFRNAFINSETISTALHTSVLTNIRSSILNIYGKIFVVVLLIAIDIVGKEENQLSNPRAWDYF